jgi:hypothetical protein
LISSSRKPRYSEQLLCRNEVTEKDSEYRHQHTVNRTPAPAPAPAPAIFTKN